MPTGGLFNEHYHHHPHRRNNILNASLCRPSEVAKEETMLATRVPLTNQSFSCDYFELSCHMLVDLLNHSLDDGDIMFNVTLFERHTAKQLLRRGIILQFILKYLSIYHGYNLGSRII